METLKQLIKTNRINLHYHASHDWECDHPDTLYTLYIKLDHVVLSLSRVTRSRNFNNYYKYAIDSELSTFRYTKFNTKLGFIARKSVFSNTLSTYKSSNNENEEGYIYGKK